MLIICAAGSFPSVHALQEACGFCFCRLLFLGSWKQRTQHPAPQRHINNPHVVSKLDTVHYPYCLATITLRQIGLSSQRGGKVCSLSSASRTISGGRRGPKGRRKRPGKLKQDASMDATVAKCFSSQSGKDLA